MKHLTLLAVMAAHMAAFTAKAQAVGAYEKRDEPSVKSVADALDKIATAFDEYKKTNDARLEAVKSGASTEAMDAKLAKIDAHIDGLGEVKTKLEKMETKLAVVAPSLTPDSYTRASCSPAATASCSSLSHPG